jgi:hypothetical protein
VRLEHGISGLLSGLHTIARLIVAIVRPRDVWDISR